MFVALTKNVHLTTCYFTKNCLGKQGKDIFYLPKVGQIKRGNYKSFLQSIESAHTEH